MKRSIVVAALGTAQTLAWGSSYYLPATLADPIAQGLGLSRTTVFGLFSGALLLSAVLGPGASTTAAIAAAALVGPAQVAARLVELGALRIVHPLVSARLAALLHPIGAVILGLIGPDAITAFAMLHGAGNGLLTIAKGTVPLAIFGPVGYGLRSGILGAPARSIAVFSKSRHRLASFKR